MATTGIYTLANDQVYDQLVALLNSIEANAGRSLPVAVIAYDDRLEKVAAEIDRRPQVTLLHDPALFAPWEEFSLQVWQTHPQALAQWQAQGVKTAFFRVGENHRYGAFNPEAPFESFIYMDADTLLLQPVDFIFEKLQEVDFVLYDFQYKDPGHIYSLESPRLGQVFSTEAIERSIFCSGFYGAKRGLITPDDRQWLLEQLRQGDGEILYPRAPNQSLLNYMVMKLGLKVYNFGRELPPAQRTGNSVTSSHFEQRDRWLYDKGNPLTFLHYIGVSSRYFNRLCQGENLMFPYRDLFLDYRYAHEPHQRPVLQGKPQGYNQSPGFWQRLITKATKRLGL
jgi:hypothetical protein